MTIILTNAAASAAAQDQENISAPVPAAAMQAPAAPAEAASKSGLLDDVWSRFSQIFSSANAAANTAAADTVAYAAPSTATDTPASEEKSRDETRTDTDLPAMALSLMPVILNFPSNAGTQAIVAPSLPVSGKKEDTEDTAIAGMHATGSRGGPAIRNTPAQDGGMSLSLPVPAAPETANPAYADSTSAALTTRGNIRAMAEASLAANSSRPTGASNTGDGADLIGLRSNGGTNGIGGEHGAAALSTAGNNAGANLWSSSAVGFNAASAAPADTLKLPGNPAQWQQPLREALGDRLQMQLGRNSEQAVIRLDPPMLGRIEISIRHEAGALQVNMSASNNEVLRQLHGIGDGLRQDLSHRQYTEVAVTVSATPRSNAGGNSADADGRQRQAQTVREQEENLPSRALADAEQATSGFATLTDRE